MKDVHDEKHISPGGRSHEKHNDIGHHDNNSRYLGKLLGAQISKASKETKKTTLSPAVSSIPVVRSDIPNEGLNLSNKNGAEDGGTMSITNSFDPLKEESIRVGEKGPISSNVAVHDNDKNPSPN